MVGLKKCFIRCVLLGGLLGATQSFGWNFSTKILKNYSDDQIVVLKESFNADYKYGIDAAALSVVETQAGLLHRDSDEFCGAHQISLKNVRAITPVLTEVSDAALCRGLIINPRASAMYSVEILKYFVKNSSSFDLAVKRYNGGWDVSKHGVEFYRRFSIAKNIIIKNRNYIEERYKNHIKGLK